MIKLILITLIVLSQIGIDKVPSKETVLAKVGDKTISLNEFLRRAEYTIRPAYCRGNTNIDKKIILNSLIAEKLFSLEAGNNNEFISAEKVTSFLRGRKEQAMRNILIKEEVNDKIKYDKDEINTLLDRSTREYEVSYVSLSDTLVVEQLRHELIDLKQNFDSTLTMNYGLNKIPKRKVIFSESENVEILQELYYKEISHDTVIGPIKYENNTYLFLKIDGWKKNLLITENQRNIKLEKIKNILNKQNFPKYYQKYVREVMKNKEIIFNKDIFEILATILGPVYYKDNIEKEDNFESEIWELENRELPKLDKNTIDKIKDEIIFSFDEEQWTVLNLFSEINEHPLIFRINKFPKIEFGYQLQMAIMDLMRDKYLTSKAYDKKIDKRQEVIREYNLWYDNLNSLYFKDKMLKNEFNIVDTSKNQLKVLENYLVHEIDKLQQKYSKNILIDTELFNEINITNVDMFVTYSNNAYSAVVPFFPILTNDPLLDYGSKIK